MGKWLELFRTLQNSGIEGLTDSDTSRHTAPCVDHRPLPHDRSPHLDVLTHGPVRHGVSLSVSPSIPLKHDLPTPTLVNRNRSRFSAIPSSIDEPDAATCEAALTVFCDFETRNVSGCDLTKAGVWRYATDPATEIICFGYRAGAVDHSWAPTSSSRDPLEDMAANPDVAFVCFGGFEQVIWQKIMVERHGFAPISTKRWIDLRATCCSFALPRSLDKALTALGLPVKKDKEGQRLVRSLSRPNRKTGAYPELTPAIIERVVQYNRIDILALEAMRKQGLLRLTTSEQAVWELDQRINARGIAIDTGFVQAAKRMADQVMGEAFAEFAQLTDGVSPHQVRKIREWLRSRKCALPNLEAETVSESLELAGLPDDVRRVLEIRQITAAASLKKLDAMLACVGPDGRARGLLHYHGATTGRWSGQLIQPQNFPRPTLEADVDPEELAAAVKTGDPDALRSWAIRSTC
jgi:DNA polymerase